MLLVSGRIFHQPPRVSLLKVNDHLSTMAIVGLDPELSFDTRGSASC